MNVDQDLKLLEEECARRAKLREARYAIESDIERKQKMLAEVFPEIAAEQEKKLRQDMDSRERSLQHLQDKADKSDDTLKKLVMAVPFAVWGLVLTHGWSWIRGIGTGKKLPVSRWRALKALVGADEE